MSYLLNLSCLLLAVWVCWLGYILVMGLRRAQMTGRLSKWVLVLASPVIISAILLDVLVNLAVAPILFLDFPQELLLTSRLQRYNDGADGWRKTASTFICEHLLDVFDPSGDHC